MVETHHVHDSDCEMIGHICSDTARTRIFNIHTTLNEVVHYRHYNPLNEYSTLQECFEQIVLIGNLNKENGTLVRGAPFSISK